MPSKECLNESSNKGKYVTLVIWKPSPGGIEKSLLSYLEYFKNNINFTIFSLREVDVRYNIFSGYRVGFQSGHNSNIIMYCKFFLYALRNRSQVFHLFNAGPIVMLILRLVSVKKIIYHVRGTIYWKNSFKKIKWKIFWHLAFNNKVLLLSNSVFTKKRFLEQMTSKMNIEVLYNPFDAKKITPAIKTQSSYLRIFYVGRLVEGKNLFLWIDAAEHILEYFPRSRFKIVGDGNLKDELSKKIREKELESYIKLTGYVEDVKNVYQENDLLLFLSKHESFGNVVVESVLTQTPVIASAIPAMKEIFSDYPEFLVELDNHIFDSIICKLKHLDSLKISVSKARKDFARKFNAENHMNRIKELYLEK